MSAPKGNKNASRARIVRDQMRWVLDNYEDSQIKQGQALRAICQEQVKKALAGDKDAVSVIFDRVEGKASQSIVNDSEQPFVINIVK